MGYHRANESGTAKFEAHTPNLDRLATIDGIRLENHYAYKICSPSRSSLQSGRLAVHVNIRNKGVTVVNPDDPIGGFAGIPRNMTCMAEKLRDGAGYRTAMVGKWDVGMATPEHTPLGRGYESWTGYYEHANDYFKKDTGFKAIGEIDNCLYAIVARALSPALPAALARQSEVRPNVRVASAQEPLSRLYDSESDVSWWCPRRRRAFSRDVRRGRVQIGGVVDLEAT